MRRYRNLIILVVMAALVAVSLYFIIPPGERTKLGLDLQGGVQVVYQGRTSDGQAPTQEQLDQTISIIDRRVNGLGVTESQVQKQGTDQVAIALPGVRDPQQALNIIGKTAQLEFFKDDPTSRPVGPVDSREQALKELRRQGVGKAEITRLDENGSTDRYALVEAPPGTTGGNPQTAWYVYRRPPAMTGAAIKKATQEYDQANRPNVVIEFTGEGSEQFQQVTRELWREGLLKQQSQTFAIVLDNVMESDPQIDYTDAQLSDGIRGNAEITGDFSLQEAKDLALVLNTGALPVRLTQIQQVQVSATLGKDSLRAGLIAGLVGLALVMLYMLAFYRFLGLVADLALLVYGILLWGLFNAVGVTLTLPGIAGMILTIGVAADANVVIFERIKEEVRVGKTVRSAVNSGYARGFKTILDANILTILTALVLFVFATAQPKGFALTLILGVLMSMLTAVLFTRALLGVLASLTAFDKPALMGVSQESIQAAQVDRERSDRRSRGRQPARERARARRAAAVAAGGDGAADEEVAAEAVADGVDEPPPSDGASGAASPARRQSGKRRSGGGRRSGARKRKKRR